MPRVLGIDPGTLSMDLCGLDDGRVFLDRTIPSTEVGQDPEALLETIRGAGPLDLVAGPSGYGLPLVRAERVGEAELSLAFLARPGEGAGIGGLRRLVRILCDERLAVVFTPGVVHLPSVPAHRKVNRVDMGTADKVCAAALAIHDQAERLGIPYGQTSLILVELGGAFTAVLAVDGGQIVDGLGGSSGPLGFRGCGALDGEVAYLLGRVSKGVVFSGGAASVAGDADGSPEQFAARRDARTRLARRALVEGVAKAVASELSTVPHAREILLSGRLADVASLREEIAGVLARFAPVHRMCGFARVKEAAQGAALIADGLAGGHFQELVGTMRLREACGTILDHLYVEGSAELREQAWLRPS